MGLALRARIPVIAMVSYGWNMRILDGLCTQSFITTELAKHAFTVVLIDKLASTRFELQLRWSSLPSTHFRVLFVVNVHIHGCPMSLLNKTLNKQTSKQNKQTKPHPCHPHILYWSSLPYWIHLCVCVYGEFARSHILLELAPIMHCVVISSIAISDLCRLT